MRDEHLPRWRLIRLFLSVLAGFMAGLAGWMLVTVAVLFTQGQTASAMPAHLIAGVPAVRRPCGSTTGSILNPAFAYSSR